MERGLLGLVIRVSRLAGVAPYMHRDKDGVSKIIFALGLISVTSISLYIAYYLTVKIININDDNRKNMLMLDMIRVFTNYLSVIVIMIGVCTSAKRIAHIVRNLKKLDKIHESIRSNKWSVTENITKHYFIRIYMLGILAMRMTDCYLKKSNIFFEISMAIVRVLVELCILQIVLFSARVLTTLKNINETLHELLPEQNEEGQSKYVNNQTLNPRLAFVYSKDDIVHFGNLNTYKYWSVNITNTDINESVAYTIRRLSKSYSIVCFIIKDTTDVNGIMLIMALLHHMMQLELINYHIFLWISYENNLSLETFFLICHGLSYVLGLFLMVDTFHQTHAQIQRTELLVKCLKCQHEPPLAMSNELDLFQHVLVLQDTTYSPLNMCTLDRSLLVKIYGMLISYLVIIITYGPSLDPNANKDMLDSLLLTPKF